MAARLIVLKFGSSVLSDRERLPAVVHDIYREVRQGSQLVVVVSAIGCHTDLLLEEARYIAEPATHEAALASLLGTGEQQSAALLAMAVERAGIPCTLLETASMQLTVRGGRLDADPISVNRGAFEQAFEQAPVAIVPGFVGRHEQDGPALMGRGGSDLTAVFLAKELAASACRLVKDVDGIYEADPANTTLEEAPRLFADVSYEDALRVAKVLVQPKAVELLQANQDSAEVASLLHEHGTVVGAMPSRLARRSPERPIKVALVGCGTVGEGVYQHLEALPDHFELVGIGVRDVQRDRAIASSVPLIANAEELLESPFDVLVELTGNTERAYGWIEHCLQSRRAAITADKRLVAQHGAFIEQTANRFGAAFRYSAAVGGAVPMLETVLRARAAGAIESIRGILSGTCNLVLDGMAAGMRLDEALANARSRGLTEVEPGRDVAGDDTIDTLRILARAAWGAEIGGAPIVCEGIENLTREQLMHAAKKHRCIRLVASMNAVGRGVVQLEWLSCNDPLATVTGSNNALEVRARGGAQWFVAGEGAGRWPVAEAVLADLIDVRQRILQHEAVAAEARLKRRAPVPDVG